MRFWSIDDYLATLNVMVDELGGAVDLIGLCQGGWMALLYAARFSAKVRKLVLAGAPIDIAAGESKLSDLANGTPSSIFKELVELGHGRILGDRLLQFWPLDMERDEIHRLLQSTDAIGSAAFRRLESRFRDWYGWTVDLPGSYYLQVVNKYFKENRLATGEFVALGRQIDLSRLHCPISCSLRGTTILWPRSRYLRRSVWWITDVAPLRRQLHRAGIWASSWEGTSYPPVGSTSRAGSRSHKNVAHRNLLHTS